MIFLAISVHVSIILATVVVSSEDSDVVLLPRKIPSQKDVLVLPYSLHPAMIRDTPYWLIPEYNSTVIIVISIIIIIIVTIVNIIV